jgi:hypothetical protein
MKRGTWLGVLVGVIVGFVVTTLLHNYPKREVTRHRYCRVCAEYEETYREGVILGARTASKKMFHGPLGRLMKEAADQHEHRFTDWATIFPTHGVELEHPEIAAKIQEMQMMDNDPHLIATVEQAMRNDRKRALTLMQRIIDPTGGVTAAVVIPWASEMHWDVWWSRVDDAIAARKLK